VDDVRNTKKIYQANLHHKRPKRRSTTRWKDDVENGIKNYALLLGKKWHRTGIEGPNGRRLSF